ncbi:MAG: Uma2 family endonuclease, partial [Sporomusaceae bacterium]|nr:Uma2 family endonuclease [Sporomusaceae bacterium]
MSGNVVSNDWFYTYEDYCKIDDDKRYEVINGVIYLMTAPNMIHQRISSNLHGIFWRYLRGKKCEVFHAPFDVLLPKKDEPSQKSSNIVQPDISIVCDREKLKKRGCFGSPDLIVEILSPSTSKRDMKEKFSLYQEHGVKEYWVVDPFNQIISRFGYEERSKEYQKPEYFVRDETITPLIFPDLQIKLEE